MRPPDCSPCYQELIFFTDRLKLILHNTCMNENKPSRMHVVLRSIHFYFAPAEGRPISRLPNSSGTKCFPYNFFFQHTKPALRSIHLYSPLPKGDQFHGYLAAQAQNAVPRIFVFWKYQAYQNSNALFYLRFLLVFRLYWLKGRLEAANSVTRIAKRASDVITRTNSDKQNGIVKDLMLFQARKQVFLKQFLKGKFGFQFPPISPRTR